MSARGGWPCPPAPAPPPARAPRASGCPGSAPAAAPAPSTLMPAPRTPPRPCPSPDPAPHQPDPCISPPHRRGTPSPPQGTLPLPKGFHQQGTPLLAPRDPSPPGTLPRTSWPRPPHQGSPLPLPRRTMTSLVSPCSKYSSTMGCTFFSSSSSSSSGTTVAYTVSPCGDGRTWLPMGSQLATRSGGCPRQGLREGAGAVPEPPRRSWGRGRRAPGSRTPRRGHPTRPCPRHRLHRAQVGLSHGGH